MTGQKLLAHRNTSKAYLKKKNELLNFSKKAQFNVL